MKIYIVVLSSLFLVFNTSGLLAQIEVDGIQTEVEMMTVGEDMPEFEGGENELVQFIADNLNYPRKAQKKNVEGMVIVSFVVRETGKITDITVIKDIGKGCGKEAARVVALTDGKWTPGQQRGKPVNVQYNLPVRFQLTE